jgi:hypothetical protein
MRKLLSVLLTCLIGAIAIPAGEAMALIGIGGTALAGTVCKCGSIGCPAYPYCSCKCFTAGCLTTSSAGVKCWIASLDPVQRFFADMPALEPDEGLVGLYGAEFPTRNSCPEARASFALMPSVEQVATLAAYPGQQPIMSQLFQDRKEEPLLVAKSSSTPSPIDLNCKANGAGAGNITKDPAAEVCELQILTVRATCANNGDQTGGLGKPFAVNVNLSSTNPLGQDEVTTNGRWLVVNIFDHNQILALVSGFIPPDACQNPNWSVTGVAVTSVNMKNSIFRCTDATCEVLIQPAADVVLETCTSVDGLSFSCGSL